MQSDLGCEGPRSRGEEPRPSGKVSKMILSGEGRVCVHDIQTVGLEAAIRNGTRTSALEETHRTHNETRLKNHTDPTDQYFPTIDVYIYCGRLMVVERPLCL